MKTRILVSLSTALLLSALYSPRADAEVSIGVFRTALEPHGQWIEVGDYGPCWQPRGIQADWRPYTAGRWVYTDDGWCWDSDEPYGWVVYHYGRWVDVEDAGWCWVPGTEWAPAWVSFRHSDDYIGWAPLPPEARFRPGVAISFGGWVDTYFDIGPRYYTFVPLRRFGHPRLRDVILGREDNINIFVNTTNITNIRFRDNRVFVGGMDYDRLSGRLESRIPRLRLEREMNFAEDARADRFRSRIESDRFIVPAPQVRGNPRDLAQNVGRRIERPEFNRGWKDVPEDRASELRQKLERESEPPSEVRRELTPIRGREPGTTPEGRQPGDQERSRESERPESRGERRDEAVGRDREDRQEAGEGRNRPDRTRDGAAPQGSRRESAGQDESQGRQDRTPGRDPDAGRGEGTQRGERSPSSNQQRRQESQGDQRDEEQRSKGSQENQPQRNQGSRADSREQPERSQGSRKDQDAKKSPENRNQTDEPQRERSKGSQGSQSGRSESSRQRSQEQQHGYRSESGRERAGSSRSESQQKRSQASKQDRSRAESNPRAQQQRSQQSARSERSSRSAGSDTPRPSREVSGERQRGQQGKQRER